MPTIKPWQHYTILVDYCNLCFGMHVIWANFIVWVVLKKNQHWASAKRFVQNFKSTIMLAYGIHVLHFQVNYSDLLITLNTVSHLWLRRRRPHPSCVKFTSPSAPCSITVCLLLVCLPLLGPYLILILRLISNLFAVDLASFLWADGVEYYGMTTTLVLYINNRLSTVIHL